MYASYDVTRDDNLFRLSEGAVAPVVNGTSSRSDTYTRAEAGLRAGADVGRQHFSLNANANRTTFRKYGFLDYTGGAANTAWDWRVGNQWNGNVGYSYARTLASFELQGTGQDLRTQTRGFANANYRFHPSWRTHLGIDNNRARYSRAASREVDFEGRSGEVGLQYVAPSESALGVRHRQTDGDYPNRQLVNGTAIDNSYDQTDTGLTLDWRLSGQSRLTGGLDYTQRNQAQLSQRDYSGGTGRVAFDWNEGEKLTWRVGAWHELSEADDLAASYVVADGVSLTPGWAISSKLKLEATASRVEREYRGDPRVVLLVLTERREDVVKGARLALQYLPTSKIGVSLSYLDERRTSNVALADYRDRIVNAGLRVEF